MMHTHGHGAGPAACPACGGTQGYNLHMVVSHSMHGSWGEESQQGDNTLIRQSLVECADCRARFKFESLQRKGLAK